MAFHKRDSLRDTDWKIIDITNFVETSKGTDYAWTISTLKKLYEVNGRFSEDGGWQDCVESKPIESLQEIVKDECQESFPLIYETFL